EESTNESQVPCRPVSWNRSSRPSRGRAILIRATLLFGATFLPGWFKLFASGPKFARPIFSKTARGDHMLDRRRIIQGGLVTAACITGGNPDVGRAQPKVKVRYNEVVRSVLFVPAYIAIAKGYLEEQGIEQTMMIAQGGDKSMAALLGKDADIALNGP